MLGFQQFTDIQDEIQFLINHSYQIPRSEMPQITGKNEQFLDYLKSIGVEVKNKPVEIKDYRIAQGELDLSKILKMKDSDNLPPIIVSNDQILVDGNHRYASKYLKDKTSTIDAKVIDLPIVEVLNKFKEYSKES